MKKNILPKFGNFIIPGIKNKLKALLQKNELIPEVSPKKFFKKYKTSKHRYNSVCVDKNECKIVFYARVHNNEDARNKVRREISFLEEMKKNDFKINKYVPKIIDYGIENDFEWFTREYIKGDALGDIYGLRKRPSIKLVNSLLGALESLLKTSSVLKNNKNLKLEKRGAYGNYLIKIPEYKKLLIKKTISERNYCDVKKFFKNNKKIINKQDNYIVHGDFHPGNIIFKNNKFWIVDWELVQINNFIFDISFFWLHSKGSIFSRNLLIKFLHDIKQKELAKKLFRISLLFLLSGEILRLQSLNKGKNKNIEKDRRFFIEVLNNALIGFEEVINMSQRD